ncbi:IclR family transcriptional regulator [Virgibacillus sp. JSM 102003]|uniref:IclR family transcriptional regulator n=1 Tax=Virgibacillus sp. JSM 102003 TaxID=1562108 RepID=UPI0035C22A79
MVKQKYWVPALERSNLIIEQIATNPDGLRLIDLANRLEINKSSMYSLLNTMEKLGWIEKGQNEKYNLGSVLGFIGSTYLNQFNIMETFSSEAKKAIQIVDEHIQLGKLMGGDVFYIGREEGSSPVRLVTDPGTRFAAYASAIGKIQLAQYEYDELKEIYKDESFKKKTDYTVENIDQLWDQLQKAKIDGYVVEEQEGAEGFYCVGAPVYDHSNRIVYGISFTMPKSSWIKKKEIATKEIIELANKLSKISGYLG